MGKTYKKFVETDMRGPFKLDSATVSKVSDALFGVYALTMIATNGIEIVIYVGRGNLKDRTTAHLTDSDATHFYMKELKTELDGYREECRLFHKYGEEEHLDNEIHPAKPNGNTTCSTCGG